MIRRVFKLERGLLWDCYYIVNTFMDAGSGGEWVTLKYLVDSGQSVMFVDERANGFVNGFLIGNVKSDCATVDNLFVDKKAHRGGIGSALLKAYEDYCIGVGARQIKLKSRPTKQALEFYQKHGYVKLNWEYQMQKSL
ncbi:MAG: GNAT family N-acetyltransferase [Alphaproteobacteria bacterium]|nr:GNAT family N-acetyltransferase [Alphaproteobacteria bacterium]